MKLLTTLLFLLTNLCIAQKVTGKWKTIDDNTGKEKSIIEITERAGKIYGKILQIFVDPGQDPDPVCDKCDVTDSRYKKKVIGMEIIKDLTRNGNDYEGGNILDPEIGKVYSCKIWVENAELKVRGYWGIFYRTQTWKKVP